MYTLIVFIFIFGQHSQLAVPGFHNQQACVDAAKLYTGTVSNEKSDPGHQVMFVFACVKK